VIRWLVLAALVAGCAAPTADGPPASDAPPASDGPRWTTRAIPEARGDVTTAPNGARRQLRYPGWPQDDFSAFRTYAYDDTRPEVPVTRAGLPAGVHGDPKRGRALFLDRAKGPCAGCHLIPGDDVWPAGGVGPDLSTIADRKLSDAYLFQQIYDPRVVFPKTIMPPWGAAGLLTPEQIVHLVAFLQTLHGPVPPEKDPERNPATRRKPTGIADNLDPTANPAIVLAEGAQALWAAKGPAGKACADCHAGGPERSMRGVAARYPKYVKAWRRVMSIEDFLTVHGPATTGRALPAESDENIRLTVLVKMASNGMPVDIDVTSDEARAALARGQATFEKRVGERNHACADCHTPDRGANKFLGGRFLPAVAQGLTRHFPTWRTAPGEIWDLRKRMQWCMTPLGANMLPADAVEYAELELYLASFDRGKPLSVPGIRN
jgi:sulfur-oxidizing protein SoxA